MTSNKGKCPICGEGSLSAQVQKVRTEYNGVVEELDSHYSVCDVCGSEQAGAAELRLNKRIMVAFKKRASDLLSGDQVRRIRVQLGLSQKQAAEIFGGGPVAFSKYENDNVVQSESMDKLLRIVAACPEALKVLTGPSEAQQAHAHVPYWSYIPDAILDERKPHKVQSRHEVNALNIDSGWKKEAA